MAYTTINKSTSFQNQLIWDGTGATNARTGLGFQPDFCWGKERSSTSGSILQDSVQGLSVYLASNSTSGTSPTSVQFTSFDSDGFTLGTSTGINQSGQTNVGWAWKAGTTAIPSGSTTDPSAVSINTTSGFGMYKITAPGSGDYVLKHGLGATPAMVIVKRTDGTQKWMVWSKEFSNATDDYIVLNTNAAKATYSTCWGTMNSTDCTIATGGTLDTGAEHIIYVFTEKLGYSKSGSYVGNGNANGTFVYTGFKPSFVMIKLTNGSAHWSMFDNKRLGYNTANRVLYANETAAEETLDIDLLSNGFKPRTTDDKINDGNYIYLAMGQTVVGTNNIPATAR